MLKKYSPTKILKIQNDIFFVGLDLMTKYRGSGSCLRLGAQHTFLCGEGVKVRLNYYDPVKIYRHVLQSNVETEKRVEFGTMDRKYFRFVCFFFTA